MYTRALYEGVHFNLAGLAYQYTLELLFEAETEGKVSIESAE
jgi:hypothetical protein